MNKIRIQWKMQMVIRIVSQKAIFLTWTNESKAYGFILVNCELSAEVLNQCLFARRKWSSNSLMNHMQLLGKVSLSLKQLEQTADSRKLEQAADKNIQNMLSYQHSKFSPAQQQQKRNFYAQCRAGCKDMAILYGCAKRCSRPRSLVSRKAHPGYSSFCCSACCFRETNFLG